MKRSILFAAFAAVAVTAQANPTVVKNGLLASKDGKTLYTFAKDAAGKSNCNGGCAATWPPFAVANPALADSDFSIVTREDGSRQWAFKSMPLYFYAADTQPGDAKGEGKGGAWFATKAQAQATTSGVDDSKNWAGRNVTGY
jgi:predicted lipoprotein with Yx(FWY)xxD motif